MNLPKIKSAGILPYAVNNKGDVSFLLGKECYDPGWREGDKWSLFGGKVEPKETPLEGAARECYEETAGTIFILPEIVQKLKAGEYRVCIDVVYKKTRFMCYLMQVPYLDYPRMFRKTKAFLQYTKGNIECIEKNQLKWFTAQELQRYICPHHSHHHHHQQHKHSYYDRVPIFRRKFADTMGFFFRMNGVNFLLPRSTTSGQTYPPKPHYFLFRAPVPETASSQSAKNSVLLN